MTKLNIKATTFTQVQDSYSKAKISDANYQKSLGIATVHLSRGCTDPSLGLLKDKSSKASAPNPLQVLNIKEVKTALEVEGKQATLDRMITVANKLYKMVQDTNRSKNPYTVTAIQLDRLLLKLEIIDSEGNILKTQSQINEALKPTKEKAEKAESESESETEAPEIDLSLEETADAIALAMQKKCGENFNIKELLNSVTSIVEKSESYKMAS